MQHKLCFASAYTHYTRLFRNDYWAVFVYWHLYFRNDLPYTGIRRTSRLI